MLTSFTDITMEAHTRSDGPCPASFTHGDLACLEQLKFKSRCLQKLLVSSSDLNDPFSRLVLASAYENAIAYDRVMTQYSGDPRGVEFKSSSAERWAFVLPDVSTPGMTRVQFFDERGFSGHRCFQRLDDAVHEMIRDGYSIPDQGRLDLLSETPPWKQGQQVSHLLFQLNTQQITHNEFCRLVATV